MDERILDEKAVKDNGGLVTDSETVEPVTGNKVPPGANLKNVRDDIPTQLSSDEYVVPADVLRYYGVRFFEDLRSQAKQGMMDMESEGRIGGAPVDSRGVPMQGQDEELTPEEEQMLAQAMSSTSGMAEGGTVFDRGDFTLTNTGSDSVIEDRIYFNPNTGQKKTISFMSGTAMGSIPAGFVPWTQALQDTYNATKAQTPKQSSNGNDRNDNTNTPDSSALYSSWADQNYEAITNNPYDFGMNALKTPDDSTGLAGGLIGIITGRDKDIQNIANANAALKLMEAKGLTGSDQYKTLTESVKSYVSQISPLEQGLILTKVAGTGNGYLKAIEEKEKQSPAATPPAPKPSTGTSSGTSPSTSTAPSTGGDNKKDDKEKDKPVDQQAAYSQPRPFTMGTQAPKPTPTSSQGGSNTYSSSTYGSGSASYTPPKPVVPQGGRAGFEEGGLVTKPKKTRAKTKGLAGKQ